MSLNQFLIQLVLFTCVFLLLQAHRLARGWLVACIAVLTVLGGCFWIVPESAGLISGGLWFLVILLPLLGFARVNRLVAQERFEQAHRVAALLRWLHPADGYVEYPELLKGLALGQRGEMAAATQIFNRYQSNRTSTGRMATALFYRLSGRWRELLEWVEASVPASTLDKETMLTAAYLRSLGEVGDLNQLLQGVEQFERKLGRSSNPTLNLVRLYALAFCGQPQLVQQLLNSSLSAYPASTRQFWLATAEMAAGNQTIARELLESMRCDRDVAQANAVQQRLAQPLVHPGQVLTDSSKQILAQIQTAIQQEARYSYHLALAAKKSYATYALIVANLIMFGLVTALGGSDSLYVLYRLGALVPELVVAGEWWRSLAALFLHSGILHLTANMFGLYIFGALVEATLGRGKFLVCYFFSGIGSMLAVTSVALLTQSMMQLTVGASGAVLGMVGAEAAIQLKGWRVEKAKIARDRLQLILFVVVLQVLSDLVTPQVSLIGHVSGLALGFLAGMVLFKIQK